MIARFSLVVLSLSSSTALCAQRPAYARSRKDTLHLREQTSAKSTLTTRTSTIVMTSDVDASIAISFAKDDTARAWYEALSVAANSPAGKKLPNTTAALKKPFLMRFLSNGKIDHVTAPKLPASVDSVSDLHKQFDDFFLPLPDKPLVKGFAWVDSSDALDNTQKANGSWLRSRRIGRYRVERDTSVGGKRSLVISAIQQLHIESGAPLPGGIQNGMSQNVLAGADTGLFVFDPAGGRMLGRKRQGMMKGTFTMRPREGVPYVVGQEMRYTNIISERRK